MCLYLQKLKITIQTYKIKCTWLEIKYGTEIFELLASDWDIIFPFSTCRMSYLRLIPLTFEIRFNNISKFVSNLKENTLFIFTKTDSITDTLYWQNPIKHLNTGTKRNSQIWMSKLSVHIVSTRLEEVQGTNKLFRDTTTSSLVLTSESCYS